MLLPNFYIAPNCKKTFLVRDMHIYYDLYLKSSLFYNIIFTTL